MGQRTNGLSVGAAERLLRNGRALCSVPLQVDKVKKWWQSERFLKTKRPYTAEEVVRLRSPLTRGQFLSLPQSLTQPPRAVCPIRSAGNSTALPG